MNWRMLEQAEFIDSPLNRSNTITRLRRCYFSLGGETAMRYGIGFEHLIEHLWNARRIRGQIRGHIRLRCIVHIEDLIHCVACREGISVAWGDLREQHERFLIRQCANRIEESDAIVFVRRYLKELQQGVQDPKRSGCVLSEFIGDRPLRLWLGERITDATSSGVAIHRARRSTVHWTTLKQNHDSTGSQTKGDTANSVYRFPASPHQAGPHAELAIHTTRPSD